MSPFKRFSRTFGASGELDFGGFKRDFPPETGNPPGVWAGVNRGSNSRKDPILIHQIPSFSGIFLDERSIKLMRNVEYSGINGMKVGLIEAPFNPIRSHTFHQIHIFHEIYGIICGLSEIITGLI